MICFYSRFSEFLLKSFFLFVFICPSVSISLSAEDGGKLFKQNCSRCHTIGKGKLTGPDLQGVLTRVPSETWMHAWIKNNKAVLKSGDAYANKIFNENGKQNMDVFDGVLSDEQIDAVIAYVKNPPAEKKENAPTAAGENAAQPQEKGLPAFTILLIAAIALLILVSVLGSVKKHLQDSVNAKKGLPPSEPQSAYQWVRHHKRITALIVIILGGFCVRWIYIGVMNIGVYDTYKPTQPIKFSHQVHAGKLSINCVYCHSGAEKGKTAGVPSANVCMNCHKAISEGPLTGKVEIAKIYDAVGWDPAKGAYTKPQHPLKWNRVHALPDFAYFNHSQHVVVGKQDCKNCHGDIASMDVAQQISPLTMGWCIDCHRKTEVPGMASNPYYADLHAKLKEKYKGEPITVEKMGGLDCIKCHY
ncbi:MAG: c-type cytochrome [Bacteroidetes bacterium]|nr:c-type cytochrome [Bacteroidota bacterium]